MMDGGQITAVLIVFTICATMVLLRVMSSKYKRRDKEESPDIETMQEMNRGLQRMEDRIEALETLLMDSQKKRQAKSEFE
jgi:phage shock protein B